MAKNLHSLLIRMKFNPCSLFTCMLVLVIICLTFGRLPSAHAAANTCEVIFDTGTSSQAERLHYHPHFSQLLPHGAEAEPLLARGLVIIEQSKKAIALDLDAPERKSISVLLSYKQYFIPTEQGNVVQAAWHRERVLSALVQHPVVYWYSWESMKLMGRDEGNTDEFKRVFPYLMENAIQRFENPEAPVIYFDLTGVSSTSPRDVTAFEAKSIFGRDDFVLRTQFIRDNQFISAEQARILLKNSGWLD